MKHSAHVRDPSARRGRLLQMLHTISGDVGRGERDREEGEEVAPRDGDDGERERPRVRTEDRAAVR